MTIPRRERRDFCPYFEERDRQIRDTNIVLLIGALIFFLSALVFAVVTVFHLGDVAHASERINYSDVHTAAQLCRYARENPGAITNLGTLCV